MNDYGLRPIVIIRFNPDDYISYAGVKVTSCWGIDKQGLARVKPSKKAEYSHRLNVLRDSIRYYLNNVPDKEVSQIKLFYDNYCDERTGCL
jgi:hypothetical protein